MIITVNEERLTLAGRAPPAHSYAQCTVVVAAASAMLPPPPHAPPTQTHPPTEWALIGIGSGWGLALLCTQDWSVLCAPIAETESFMLTSFYQDIILLPVGHTTYVL